MRRGPDQVRWTVRPMLVILLGILVVPLSLAFGLSLAFTDEVEVGPIGRVLVALALFVAPVVVTFQLHSLGWWTSLAAGLIASGSMLVLVVPLAVALPPLPFAVAGTALMVGLVWGTRAVVRASTSRPADSAPPRPDLPAW